MGCPRGYWCCVEDRRKFLQQDTSVQLRSSVEEKYLKDPSEFIQDDP